MPEPATPQLSESDVGAIESRPAYPWVRFERDSDPGEAKHLPRAIVLTPAERDALIRDWRALKARNSELESSVTFWQAEALLNHFCSEHAKNTRQIGHYCTICARPFVMSVPQGERPPKYKDLIAENAALREQLAEANADNERLALVIQSIEEREAAVCPEDVGFDEYIRTLEQKLKTRPPAGYPWTGNEP